MTSARGLLAASIACALGIVAVAGTLVQHADARARWAAESTRVGQDGYSSERSDTLYRHVDDLRARARVVSWATATAMLVLGMVLGARRGEHARGGPARARRAALPLCLAATSALDALVTGMLLGATLGARAARTGSPALDDTLAILAPALALALVAALLASGETPGTALTRVERTPWSPLRAPLALLALPLTLALPATALVALVRRGRRERAMLAPHLAVLGALGGAHTVANAPAPGVRSRA